MRRNDGERSGDVLKSYYRATTNLNIAALGLSGLSGGWSPGAVGIIVVEGMGAWSVVVGGAG